MAEKSTKFFGAALAVVMAGGCAEAAPKAVGITPIVRRAVLDCPSLPGQSVNRQVILDGLTPGQRVFISNRSTELSPHYIEVQEDGRFAVLGENPRQHQPGEQFAASGYPDNDATIFNVVAGEPEFPTASNGEPRWHNAGSAITAFCIVPGLRSPYGNFVPVETAFAAPTANQG